MKQLIWFGLTIVVLAACQNTKPISTSGEPNNVNKVYVKPVSVGDQFNPKLLQLQFLALDYKLKLNKWPQSKTDILSQYGDSVNIFFDNFSALNFSSNADSLVLDYKLNASANIPKVTFEFMDLDTADDSISYNITGDFKVTKNNDQFKIGEGIITIQQTDEHIFHISHKLDSGKANFKIERLKNQSK